MFFGVPWSEVFLRVHGTVVQSDENQMSLLMKLKLYRTRRFVILDSLHNHVVNFIGLE